MKTISIEIPDGKKAEWVNGVLTLTDEKPKDITERVKTFEDACEVCKELGFSHLVDAHDSFWHNVHASVGGKYLKDVDAYLALRIITTALNEGWEPQFTEDEYRYYPYFYLYTQKEIDEMDEDDRKKVWLWGGGSRNGSRCGLGASHSSSDWTNASSDLSARLAFKTPELAKYAGRQFIEIFADYVTLKPQSKEEQE